MIINHAFTTIISKLKTTTKQKVKFLFWAQRIKKAFVIQVITKAFFIRGRIGDGFGVNVWVVCLHQQKNHSMKNLLLPIVTLIFVITGCNSMTETEKAIFDYLKSVSNDPSSLELVKFDLVNKETVSDCFERYLKFANEEEKTSLKQKEEELSNNATIVSYCYKAQVRSKNALGALVLNDVFVLFDKDMKPLNHDSGMMGLSYNQMKSVLFDN